MLVLATSISTETVISKPPTVNLWCRSTVRFAFVALFQINRLWAFDWLTKLERVVVGTFLEPFRGRRNKPIHSIPYSVVYSQKNIRIPVCIMIAVPFFFCKSQHLLELGDKACSRVVKCPWAQLDIFRISHYHKNMHAKSLFLVNKTRNHFTMEEFTWRNSLLLVV